MFVGVIFSVMYKFFGQIHSVMLIRSNDLPSKKAGQNIQQSRPSFPLGELGTFALFKLPAFWWGAFIKMKVVYMKC